MAREMRVRCLTYSRVRLEMMLRRVRSLDRASFDCQAMAAAKMRLQALSLLLFSSAPGQGELVPSLSRIVDGAAHWSAGLGYRGGRGLTATVRLLYGVDGGWFDLLRDASCGYRRSCYCCCCFIHQSTYSLVVMPGGDDIKWMEADLTADAVMTIRRLRVEMRSLASAWQERCGAASPDFSATAAAREQPRHVIDSISHKRREHQPHSWGVSFFFFPLFCLRLYRGVAGCHNLRFHPFIDPTQYLVTLHLCLKRKPQRWPTTGFQYTTRSKSKI